MEKNIKKDTKKEPAQNSSNIKAGEEKLKKDLEDCKAKCEEYLNGWKRERADFLNYKKDEMERIGQLAKYANEEIILKIIPILDNICLAESHVPDELKNNPSASSGQVKWIEGFLQIKKQVSDFLAKEGIEAIKTIGEKFNPNFMEVVEEVEGKESGVVVEETQKGYTMYGKIIRVAKVKVSK
jgi:molecular chaperone GrpE